MKSNAEGNTRRARAGTLAGILKAVVLPAALLLVLPLLTAGCGDLNDNPYPSGFTAQINFDDLAQAQSVEDGGFSVQAITGPVVGDPVLSVVVGAILISRSSPYKNAELALVDGFTSTERDALEADAKNSVKYLEIIQLPHPSNTVSFNIPPDNAGNWQLAAVGLRHQIGALDEIQSNSPIWYGFTDTFMNNVVGPGSVVTLTMEPWCEGNDDPPGAIGGGAPC